METGIFPFVTLLHVMVGHQDSCLVLELFTPQSNLVRV